MYQDFDFDLPTIGDTKEIIVDAVTGAVISEKQPSYKYEGSYTTSIMIRISGRRITISRGNPSRIDRLDNLFGYKSIDHAVLKYNQILISLGLPPFTKCTKFFRLTGRDGKGTKIASDGAIITEIHITTNKSVGEGNTRQYLRGLASQPYRNSVPELKPNGFTVHWKSKKGNASLIYPCVYDKANELELHHLGKTAKKYGKDSKEYKYLFNVIEYCRSNGVVRFEQKLKSAYLRRNNLQFYGLSDYSVLEDLQQEFLDIETKLKVTDMKYENISDTLVINNICPNTKSAMVTASYVYQWMHGSEFDFSKSHMQKHRARLRKIGIDIKQPCDLTKFSPVQVSIGNQIESKLLEIPQWYEMPKLKHLRLVA